MSDAHAIIIPSSLAVLQLPHPLVLHPSLVLAVSMPYGHALALLRAALALAKQPTALTDDPSPAGRKRTIVVAALPAPADAADNPSIDARMARASPNAWACAARLLRLIRHPTSDQCTLLVMGLARVQIHAILEPQKVSVQHPADQDLPTPPDPEEKALVPAGHQRKTAVVEVIQGSVHNIAQLTPPAKGDDALAHLLRSAAHELLDALSSFSLLPPLTPPSETDDTGARNTEMGAGSMPYVPPSLVKRLRSLVHEMQDEAAPVLADVLAGSVGGACAWPVRLSLLAAADPRERVETVAQALRQGAQRIRDTRQVLDALLAPLNSDSRETLLRLQLQSLVASMAAVTPSVSARLTTPKGTFLFNTDADRNNSERAPSDTYDNDSRRRALSADAMRLLNSLRNNALKRSSSNNPRNPSGAGPGGPGSAEDEADNDEEHDEIAQLASKLADAQLSPEARKVCDRELKRLSRIPSQSVERGVLVSYLELMAELPWDKTTSDLPWEEQRALGMRNEELQGAELGEVLRADEHAHQHEGIVDRAKRILNEDHYGLDKVKRRLVEYLAVLELKTLQAYASQPAALALPAKSPPEPVTQDQLQIKPADINDDSQQAPEQPKKLHIVDKGPILLLVGPPGTGKTSIAVSRNEELLISKFPNLVSGLC